jgi:hypothetical protein
MYVYIQYTQTRMHSFKMRVNTVPHLAFVGRTRVDSALQLIGKDDVEKLGVGIPLHGSEG